MTVETKNQGGIVPSNIPAVDERSRLNEAMVVRREDVAMLQPSHEAANATMSAILRAASDPTVDVGKVIALAELHRTMVADQRRVEFHEALSRLLPKLPRINKRGRIEYAPRGSNDVQLQSKYALLEDIDAAIKPLLIEEGFSMRFNTEQIEGSSKVRVVLYVSRNGHTEEQRIELPPDKSGSKNDAQAVISAVSYGRRALVTMFFNLICEGQDDDGAGGSEKITQNQADDLRLWLEQVGRTPEKFLAWAAIKQPGLVKFEDILVRHYDEAVKFIDQARRLKK